MPPTDVATGFRTPPPPGGCYRIQVLVVGRQKHWRDAVSAQVRGMGYQPTACDRGVDAMRVLALGLPVDVLVIDALLQGGLCCAQLVLEARALRPSLRIVLVSDPHDALAEEAFSRVPDAVMVDRGGFETGMVASTVRDALGGRVA